ncbi:unnamed protein product [Schistosoma haematobium]|nr:unnamed protein product [Schistosoma haematobium]
MLFIGYKFLRQDCEPSGDLLPSFGAYFDKSDSGLFSSSYQRYASKSVLQRLFSSESFGNISCKSERVRYIGQQAVQWFPGHMRKGMDVIHSKMPLVDVIIEVHDARIPFSGRPEIFQKFELNRPTILLMNKIDLAEPISDRQAHTNRIVEESRIIKRGPLEVYYTQLNAPEKQKGILKRLMSSLPHLATTSGHPANSVITVMVLGIPNSGKSTLINVLRSIGQGGPGGAARVGRTAGQTRSVGHPIILYRGNSSRISDDTDDSVMGLTDYKIQVFDTPGILEPRARTLSERLSLCVCGAVDYSSLQPEVLVDYLLFWLNRRQRTEYVSLFDLPGPTTDVNELLISVCFKNKFFLTVSKPSWLPNEIETSDELFKSNITQKMAIPDIKRAAFHILSLFNKRYFGPVTFLPEDEKLADNFFHLA